jgi:UDP-N-acetylmuramoylalanine--D-glutamate ligase
MGLGTFSGGVAAARFMARHGARVVVTDRANAAKLRESIAALDDVPIEAFRLGYHWEPDFKNADLVIANPAIREDDRFLGIARASGAEITTEMNLFMRLCPARIVGVTGSNGKSTTAALIHGMLRAAGKPAWLGGNIGRSLLGRVYDVKPHELVVLELSSFQLEDLDEIQKSPHVALVTTFTPNHLDRHPSMDEYRRAKQTILRYQNSGDLAILNADDPDVRTWNTRCKSLLYGLDDHGRDGTFYDGDRIVFRSDGAEQEFTLVDAIGIPGAHNLSNAAAAACCAMALGVDPMSIRRALKQFRTLPHRLESVAEVAHRWFIDDSIATTPESTIAALQSLNEPIWLIAGGYDKGTDFTAVANEIAIRAKGVALIGQTAAKLQSLIENCRPPAFGPILHRCESMEQAVRWCFEQSRPGESILLSPACASFGMFQNFVDRADAFRRAAQSLRLMTRQAG